MRLDDPFGRIERRHQAGYETMSKALRQAGVDSPQAARQIIAQARQRGALLLAVILTAALLLSLLLPRLLPLALGLALFATVWVVTSTINGQRYIQRYIDETLKE